MYIRNIKPVKKYHNNSKKIKQGKEKNSLIKLYWTSQFNLNQAPYMHSFYPFAQRNKTDIASFAQIKRDRLVCFGFCFHFLIKPYKFEDATTRFH